MPPFAGSLRFLARACADFLFPPVCLGCDAEIERGLVCLTCQSSLTASWLGVCSGCGRPLDRRAPRCGRCRIPFCLQRVRALGPYVPPFSRLVHALKYQQKTALARVLGEALVALVESDPELRRADVVCPVPLHPARLRERGYNQAALLADAVAAGTGIARAELLRRVRNTRTQTMLADDRGRVENLSGAFRTRSGSRVDGARVLLLDDVTTSGATLDAAGRQLLKAGASAVLGLVVAAA